MTRSLLQRATVVAATVTGLTLALAAPGAADAAPALALGAEWTSG